MSGKQKTVTAYVAHASRYCFWLFEKLFSRGYQKVNNRPFFC